MIYKKFQRNDEGVYGETKMIPDDLKKAKELLVAENLTCAFYRNDRCYTSLLRGVKPLVQLLEDKVDVAGFCVADKVVGKATAFLYVLLEVKAIYTRTISQSAFRVLQQYNILVEYELLVENIINRKGDGICPFEEAVLHIQSPQEAYTAIRAKMKEMAMV